MTMTNATLSAEGRGRPVKFTPEAIEKIKILVAQGASREEIASLLGVTLRLAPSDVFQIRHQLATKDFA